ncbi:hypothetical protein ACSBR2_024752 [Camellia fascicularis]
MGTTLCFSLILLITVTDSFFEANSITFWQDTEALREFKNGLDPNSVRPGSCLSSWDFTLDPCDNLFSDKFTCGFRCDLVISTMSRVTELALDQAGYVGSLASTSWNLLPYLHTLDLSNNFFAGSIPDSFSNLTRLQTLSLSRNSLSGSVPNSIGSLSTLEELYLDNNYFQGTIPLSLNGLKNLKRLELQGNRLSSQFPDLSQLTNLSFLDASDNSISGELPAHLPTSLVELSMRNNQLKGNIPANISNLFYLQVIDLSHNNLTGSIPSGLFTHPSLQQLTLSYNDFESVQEPGDSSQERELIAVDLSSNMIHGLIPSFMGRMRKLSALSLENNRFSDVIPAQLTLKAVLPGQGVSQLERLLLGGNYLFGAIPGQLLKMRDPGSVTVRLGDNCLYRCPLRFFFCQGGKQKSLMECKRLGHVFP